MEWDSGLGSEWVEWDLGSGTGSDKEWDMGLGKCSIVEEQILPPYGTQVQLCLVLNPPLL